MTRKIIYRCHLRGGDSHIRGSVSRELAGQTSTVFSRSVERGFRLYARVSTQHSEETYGQRNIDIDGELLSFTEGKQWKATLHPGTEDSLYGLSVQFESREERLNEAISRRTDELTAEQMAVTVIAGQEYMNS